MLYELVNFSDQIGVLNVFRYITFRTGGAIFTALIFVRLFGPGIIDLLRVKQGKGQPIREDGPETHLLKTGTPTMGGLMILAAACRRKWTSSAVGSSESVRVRSGSA